MSLLGIASLISSHFDRKSNEKIQDENRAWQLRMDNLERDHNVKLAKMQNSWNLAQWRRENAYNTPSAQKSRLEAAGLNADLMYGNGTLQNVAASSPQMTAGAPSPHTDWSAFNPYTPITPGVSHAVDAYLDSQLKQAQINKLNSETEGQDITNDILTSDAKFRDAINQGQLDTAYSTIHLQGVQSRTTEKLSEQEIKESQQRIMKLDADVRLIDTQIKEIYNSIKNDNARLEIEKALSEANIKKAAASANLDYASAKSIADQLKHIINNLKADHELKQQQKINLGHEGEILINQSDVSQFNATIRTFEGWDSDMTFYQNASKFVLQLLHGVASFIPGAKGLVN